MSTALRELEMLLGHIPWDDHGERNIVRAIRDLFTRQSVALSRLEEERPTPEEASEILKEMGEGSDDWDTLGTATAKLSELRSTQRGDKGK